MNSRAFSAFRADTHRRQQVSHHLLQPPILFLQLLEPFTVW
jgi:hypothetical protein